MLRNGTNISKYNILLRHWTGSYECRCKSGYRLNPDTSDCEDVNECLLESTNTCAVGREICVNLVGSYECRCMNNYTIFGKTYCVASNPCNSSKFWFSLNILTTKLKMIWTWSFSDPCHPNAVCMINGQSHICKCAPGYIETGKGSLPQTMASMLTTVQSLKFQTNKPTRSCIGPGHNWLYLVRTIDFRISWPMPEPYRTLWSENLSVLFYWLFGNSDLLGIGKCVSLTATLYYRGLL